jgi:hypothetical protein
VRPAHSASRSTTYAFGRSPTVAQFDVSVGVHDAEICAVEPAAAKRLGGALRVAVVAGHDVVAAHDDLAQRIAIGRNVGHRAIHDAQVLSVDHVNALAGLPCGALAGGQVSPFRLP